MKSKHPFKTCIELIVSRPTRFSRPKRTENRLIVENLAVEVSWQVHILHSFFIGIFFLPGCSMWTLGLDTGFLSS